MNRDMDEMTDNRMATAEVVCSVCGEVTVHINGSCRECFLREILRPKIGEWMTDSNNNFTFIVFGYNTKHTLLFDLWGNSHAIAACKPAARQNIDTAIIEIGDMMARGAKEHRGHFIKQFR